MMRRFTIDAAIYALPMFLAKSTGLILLPIYTRELGPKDYGFVELIAAISTILLVILPLEINQAVARFLPESRNINKQKQIIASALVFTTISFALFGLLIHFYRYSLLEIAGLENQYARFSVLIALNFLMTAIVNLIQVIFRFTNQAISSITINSIIILTNLCIVIYFSINNQLGIEQYFTSQIVAGFTGASISLLLIIKRYGLIYRKINLTILKELFRYSLPVVISSLGVILSSTADKLIISSYFGLTELGIYGAATRFTAVVGLGFFVISTAITPIVYKNYRNNETKALITSILQFTTYSSLILLLVVSFFSEKIMIALAGEQFVDGSKYIFYLVIYSIITNISIFFLGMEISKNTGLLSKINLISGLSGAICCFILVPIIGIWGAIGSSLFSSGMRLIAYIYFSQKYYYIKTPKTMHLSVIIVLMLTVYLNLQE